VFDEVMTSRLAPGGLQQAHGILPDLTTLGKYVGGGMSFGAFGGRADLMSRYDPYRADSWPHAGTFNNNVLTMSAGLAGLTEIYTAEAALTLNAFGDGLRERLNGLTAKRGLPMQFTGIGSMIHVHMRGGTIRSPADAATGDAKLRDLFFFDLLEHGCWTSKRGLMALSLAITPEHADALCAAVEDFVATRGSLMA
jgi:glutamate-1-semialdehyde 2,1-aminomutase